jgi:hypothetical protein
MFLAMKITQYAVARSTILARVARAFTGIYLFYFPWNTLIVAIWKACGLHGGGFFSLYSY